MEAIIITKKQARDIGYIQTGEWEAFDPFVGETINGMYTVTDEMYSVVSGNTAIDWTKKRKETINLRTKTLGKMVTNNDWKNLSQAFFYDSGLMTKILSSANPNGYSTMLKVLTDGENNYASENAFLLVFSMLGISWTTQEKATINSILTANNFTIQIS